MQSQVSGFTLLELVIALAIASTLALFAVPSYREYVARAHRIDAAAALYRAALFVEGSDAGGAPKLPAGLDQAPSSGMAVYRLRVLPADATNGGYTLEAQATQTGPMEGDRCGVFVLDATGLRSNRNASGATEAQVDDCWGTR